MELIYKKQPLIRARGVSYCKNLLSPRFEHSEGKVAQFFFHEISFRIFLPKYFTVFKVSVFQPHPGHPIER